ncbi:unnamed protein product, partial [marine sediment metagenome]
NHKNYTILNNRFGTHKFSIDQYKEALEITANKKENDIIKTAFVFE